MVGARDWREGVPEPAGEEPADGPTLDVAGLRGLKAVALVSRGSCGLAREEDQATVRYCYNQNLEEKGSTRWGPLDKKRCGGILDLQTELDLFVGAKKKGLLPGGTGIILLLPLRVMLKRDTLATFLAEIHFPLISRGIRGLLLQM